MCRCRARTAKSGDVLSFRGGLVVGGLAHSARAKGAGLLVCVGITALTFGCEEELAESAPVADPTPASSQGGVDQQAAPAHGDAEQPTDPPASPEQTDDGLAATAPSPPAMEGPTTAAPAATRDRSATAAAPRRAHQSLPEPTAERPSRPPIATAVAVAVMPVAKPAPPPPPAQETDTSSSLSRTPAKALKPAPQTEPTRPAAVEQAAAAPERSAAPLPARPSPADLLADLLAVEQQLAAQRTSITAIDELLGEMRTLVLALNKSVSHLDASTRVQARDVLSSMAGDIDDCVRIRDILIEAIDSTRADVAQSRRHAAATTSHGRGLAAE